MKYLMACFCEVVFYSMPAHKKPFIVVIEVDAVDSATSIQSTSWYHDSLVCPFSATSGNRNHSPWFESSSFDPSSGFKSE